MSPIARRATGAFALGTVGLVLLALFSDAAGRRLGYVPLALLGVAATAFALPYGLALVISPAPSALKVRHLAAGATAAWLAYQLAGAARASGLEDTADLFRVGWAPLVEEICKAAMLAVVWTDEDDRRDRRELVTAAVGVGIGFAMRENVVYFSAAAGHATSTAWIVLRAVPPVLAHAAFAMILGGVVAQGAIHARVVGARSQRVSLLGAAVAVVAHAVYNGVALLFARFGDDRAVALTVAWSLLAVAVAVALRNATLRVAAADEPCVTSIAPPVARVPYAMGALVLALSVCWSIPLDAAHYVAAVFTPLALGIALAWPVARVARFARVATPVLLGIALRPLVRMLELLVEVAARVTHPGLAALAFDYVTHALWLGTVSAVVIAMSRSRGRLVAVAVGTGLAAGMVGASLGGMVATHSSASRVALLFDATLRLLPRTVALGALVARFAWRSTRRAVMATGGVALFATVCDALARRLAGTLVARSALALTGVLLLVAVVADALRRTRLETVARRAVAGGDSAL